MVEINIYAILIEIFSAVLWDLDRGALPLARDPVRTAVRQHAIRVFHSQGHPDPDRMAEDIEKIQNYLFEIWDERLKNHPSELPH